MRRTIILALFVWLISTVAISAQSIEGNWLGILDAGGTKIRMAVTIENKDGAIRGSFGSIDQGVSGLELDTVAVKGRTVTFSAAKFSLSYEGTLNEAGDKISGVLKQGPASAPMVFERVTEFPVKKRPQTPQAPFPYAEHKVTYRNEADGVKLAGTLTTPKGEGKFPAVILISGSGSQDRDSTVAGHKIFLVIADHLTRNGIAVLRVDDRGIGGSDQGALTATSYNFAGDVLSGIDFLKTRPEIDPKNIGLIGHSEGGMIAQIAATRSREVSFMVTLAGLGQTGADIVTTQTVLLQKASGVSDSVTAKTVELQKKIHSILRSEKDNVKAERLVREAITKTAGTMNEEEKPQFAPVKARLEAMAGGNVSPWYRYFVAYDPAPFLRKIKIPVLALNGENDLQVASRENLNGISAGLKKAGNKDFTVKSFPKLNHLFQTSTTGLITEYEQIEETIAAEVLVVMSDWIKIRAK